MLRPLLALVSLSALALGVAVTGCASESESPQQHEDDEPETTATATSALSVTAPVSAAVTDPACSTAIVKGLATQLVEEIQCLQPNTMKRIDAIAGVKLGSSVFPYLQTAAADALVAAQKTRGTTMAINSGLRTLPQQYLLYRWYQTGRCGIGLAASPGTSNHESAVAIDIQDNVGWRTSLQGKSFRWLGASDPVHYDFKGTGAVDLRGVSVKAFQRLWNRNHPEDLIPEDSAYGASTEKRLALSPVGGFPQGAKCDVDAGAPAPAAPMPDLPPTPDATESGDEKDDKDPASTSETKETQASRVREANDDVAPGGCAASGTHQPTGDLTGVALGAIAIASSLARRRRR